MTDEKLLKELRRHNYAVPFGGQSEYAVKAADRIEQLQAQNMKLSGMVYDLKKEVAISDALLISEAEVSLARLERAEKAEDENARLREALNQSRLAFSGYVSVQYAIDLIDRAALKVGIND